MLSRDQMIDMLGNNSSGPIAERLRRLLLPARTILERRNEIGAQGILATLAAAPTSPVIAIWGAAHLPGLHRLLTAAGFVMTSSDESLAIRRTT